MQINPNLFTRGGGTDPIFKTEEEHNQYYIKKVLEERKDQYPGFYNEYFNLSKQGDTRGALAMIASMGGIPQWKAPSQPAPQPQVPSRILDINSGVAPVGGYQYNRGQGLPARRSITRRRRR